MFSAIRDIIQAFACGAGCLGSGLAGFIKNGAAFLVVSFFLIGSGSVSSSEGFELESASFELGKSFKNHSWNTIFARVSNENSSGENVTLVLELDRGSNSVIKARYSKQVWIPARSKRFVELNAYFAFRNDFVEKVFTKKKRREFNLREFDIAYSDGTKRIVKTAPHTKPLRFKIYLYKGKPLKRVDSYEIFALPFFPGANVVISINNMNQVPKVSEVYTLEGNEYVYGESDEDFSSDTVFRHENLFDKGNYPENIEAVTIDRRLSGRFLPDDYTGYSSADVVLVSDFEYSGGELALDHLEREAILGWVYSGGKIVFMPGYKDYDFSDPFLYKILPGYVSQRKVFDEKAYSGEKPKKLSFLTEDTVKPYSLEFVGGENSFTPLDSGKNPMFVKKHVAAGTSWLAGLNGENLARWKGNTEIWDSILAKNPSPLPGKKSILTKRVPQFMQMVIGVKAPDKKFMFILLGVYAAACSVILLILRFKGRAEIGWPVVIVLSLAAFVIAVWQGISARKDTGFATGQVAVSEENTEGAFSSDIYFSVFSPASFTAESPDVQLGDTHIFPFYNSKAESWKVNTSDKLNILSAEKLEVNNLAINGGEVFTCNAERAADAQGKISVDVSFDEKGIGGFVENNSGEPLKDCLLVANRRILRLGDLAGGERKSLSGVSVSGGVFSNSDFMTDEAAQLRSRLLSVLRKYPKDFFEQSSKGREYCWPITFYGWQEKGRNLLLLGKHGSPNKRFLKLVAVRAPKAEFAEQISLEKGVCSIVLLGYQSRRFFGDREFVSGIQKNRTRSALRSISRKTKANGGKKDAMKTTSSREEADEKISVPIEPTGWLETEGPAKFEVSFRLPEGLENFRPENVKIYFDIKKRDLEVGLSIMDRTRKGSRAKWDKLNWENGKAFELKNLNKYLGSKGELPVFRIDVEGGKAQAGGLSGLSRWKVKEFDIELSGTVEKD